MTMPALPRSETWQYPRTKLWARKPVGYVWASRYTGAARQVWRFEDNRAVESFITRMSKMFRYPFEFLRHDDPHVRKAIEDDTWIDAEWSGWAHTDKRKPWPFVVPVAIARKRLALIF